jgi:hypothetical protein
MADLKRQPDIIRSLQHPLQMEWSILATAGLLASTAASPVPSAGPLSFTLAMPPDDEST